MNFSFWSLSSFGRAPALQAGGDRFEPDRVHHIELAASLGASPLASAGSFARKSKGFLKSIESFCWLIWRFKPIFGLVGFNYPISGEFKPMIAFSLKIR